ncbi:MAG: PAS domain-containing sensor histidine kinase, partial [Cytophagaceae bacterium]
IDLATNRLIKSPRVAQWYGLPELTDVATSIKAIQKSDRERVSQVLTDALEPGSDGAYQVEYTVIHPQTGHQRVLRTNGQVIWHEDGQPVRIEGTVMDITLQREMQLALEQQIQQRTEELAATNEELSAMNEELAAHNEEYAAINEELEEANTLLARSNDNLQQFAYVASHDLQEPLRKIQQFGDLLKTRYAEASGQELVYLDRMQSAAARMSVLIKDLLNYSRITTQRDTSSRVALSQVVDDVLIDLDLLREETEARVEIDPLPVVEGDAGQLGQLFQNLLSNALKFRRSDVIPHIQIKLDHVASDQLPPWVKPSRAAHSYHKIDVVDNGIGFEEKYLDRIFQVFQRLHGKSEFSGTGIGLAICEKVAANHGGAITATSQPGQGATFSVYLPA